MAEPIPVEWMGNSLEVIRGFPEDVRSEIGHALYLAQEGDKHPSAKPLTGIVTGASLLEIVEDYDGDTYRAAYTVRFSGVIYVLHAFQKKSKKGKATPKQDIDLIKRRLKAAQDHYQETQQLVSQKRG